MWFSVDEVFLFLLVFVRSLHFPIKYNKHLPLEQHKLSTEPHIGAEIAFC